MLQSLIELLAYCEAMKEYYNTEKQTPYNKGNADAYSDVTANLKLILDQKTKLCKVEANRSK